MKWEDSSRSPKDYFQSQAKESTSMVAVAHQINKGAKRGNVGDVDR